jgi:hypothetical protein
MKVEDLKTGQRFKHFNGWCITIVKVCKKVVIVKYDSGGRTGREYINSFITPNLGGFTEIKN